MLMKSRIDWECEVTKEGVLLCDKYVIPMPELLDLIKAYKEGKNLKTKNINMVVEEKWVSLEYKYIKRTKSKSNIDYLIGLIENENL